MPPLVVPSPVLLDQSFPRSLDELSCVAQALGMLQSILEESRLQVLLTPTLCDFLEDCDWARTASYTLLGEIRRLLANVTLGQGGVAIRVDASDVTSYTPHPIPMSCETDGLVEIWADELGRLQVLHDEVRGSLAPPCVGVACHLAFAGRGHDHYPDDCREPYFPLVGPEDLASLDDAYEYEVPSDVHRWNISFVEAKKHIFRLGATEVKKPSGGSHFKVRFPGKRPWTLDINDDPVPKRYLKELVDITGYDDKVIKYVLKTGKMPPRRIRLRARAG